MPTKAPAKIGRYEVLEVLGRGGMGVVYKALDPILDRPVALKMMRVDASDTGDFLERFYREAKSTAALHHVNIVTVYELGEHEGSPYLAMECLEGSSLEAVLRAHGGLSLLEKINIVIQVCHGLAFAHQHGVIHRDIKPANIMVLKDGGVKIVDFGIARLADNGLTRTGQIVGSVSYMCPEQIRDLPLDSRCDVFSAGVVFYQLLTNALPFEGGSTASTIAKIISDSDLPPPLRRYLSSYPPELEAITFRALAKNRDERYASAEDFAWDLSRVQEHLSSEAIGEHLRQAQLLLDGGELVQAQEQLLQVLKIDHKHSGASTLLRNVRKQIQSEQSAKRVRELTGLAEDASKRQDFEAALGYIDQASGLDKDNPDLRKLRSAVEAAREEAEFVRRAIERAETAQNAGDLDTAQRAIEAAAERRPNDTKVKALRRLIEKELASRSRQKQLEDLVQAAHREMSARKFTAALDLLKQAEKLDPAFPQLRTLFEKLVAGHEQERRRRELEKTTSEIRQALARGEYQVAAAIAVEAIQRFPTDPSITELRKLAENQIELAGQKLYLRNQLDTAQELLESGRTEAARRVLEDTLVKAGGNPEVESLLAVVGERMAKEQAESEKITLVRQAREALERKQYLDAIRILEVAEGKFPELSDVPGLLRFARDQYAKEQGRRSADEALRNAQILLAKQEHGRAIQQSRPPTPSATPELEPPALTATVMFGGPGRSGSAPSTPEDEIGLGNSRLESELPQAGTDANQRSAPFRPETVAEGASRVPAKGFKSGRGEPVKKPGVPGARMWLAGAVCLLLAVAFAWRIRWRKPEPLQHTVAVLLRTSPSGATLTINGQDRGVSDLILGLEPGNYRLQAFLAGYDSAEESFSVAPGPRVDIDLTLQPLPEALHIISSDLEDGEVWVDDHEIGKLDSGALTLTEVPTGQHVLRIGSQLKGQRATVTFQKTTDGLTLLPSLQTHELQVVAVRISKDMAQVVGSFVNAPVAVDGNVRGQLASDGLDIPGLALGTHELAIGEAKGLHKLSFEVGSAPALHVYVYSDRDVGSILVSVPEDEVQVFVDDNPYRKRTQQGKLRIPNLKTTTHSVRVHKDGFKDPSTQTVDVAKGQESSMRFLLELLPKISTLLVEKMVPKAQVSLDNQAIGVVGEDGAFSHEVAPGDHVLSFLVPGYQPKTISRKFIAGETLHVSRAEINLTASPGVLEVVTGTDVSVAVMQGNRSVRTFTGTTTLSLEEGTYTLVTRDSNGQQVSQTVTVSAGERKSINVQIASPDCWENASVWAKQQDGWLSHRGGGFVLCNIAAVPGQYTFTLRWHHKRALLYGGVRARWVANFSTPENYVLFQLDNKDFSRTVVVNGNKQESPKIRVNIPDNASYVTITLEASATALIHRYSVSANLWQPLDAYSLGDAKGNPVTRGKFGFYTPGSDSVEMSNFSFHPR